MLHWLAACAGRAHPAGAARRRVLVDLACGGGLMAPHAARLGYRHVGVDLGLPGLELAREHGMLPVAGFGARRSAGRRLRRRRAWPARSSSTWTTTSRCWPSAPGCCGPGGTLVIDAIAATRLAALIAVRIAERMPGRAAPGPPRPGAVRRPRAAARRRRPARLDLELVGLRPSVRDAIAWRLGRRDVVRMKPLRCTGGRVRRYGRKR